MELDTTHDDTTAEAPEMSPTELAAALAQDARDQQQKSRELTRRLRGVEGELDRARGKLGAAIADDATARTQTEIHDRIAELERERDGITRAIGIVDQRVTQSKAAERDAKIAAAEAERSENVALFRTGQRELHEALVRFAATELEPLALATRAAGAAADVAHTKLNSLERPGVALNPHSMPNDPRWSGYPDLRPLVDSLIQYAHGRTHNQQRADRGTPRLLTDLSPAERLPQH